MNLLEYVGNRIRELRQAYASGEGLSQEALAKAIGVTPNTISRWETGVYRPSLEDLDKLARFFGVSILEFLPQPDVSVDTKIEALLRAAKALPDEDVEELRRYAEFRRARILYAGRSRPRLGRKPKERK